MTTAPLSDVLDLADKLTAAGVPDTTAFVLAGVKLTGGNVGKAILSAASKREVDSAMALRIHRMLRDS